MDRKHQLTISVVTDSNKARSFISSIERNSVKTAQAYTFSLMYFAKFLAQLDKIKHGKYQNYTLDSIIEPLEKRKINVYTLLNQFLSYLEHERKDLAPSSVRLYVAAVRSYLGAYEIDISETKFKHVVKLKKIPRYDEEPIDISDIREILKHINNRRLKAYILVLASGGMRTVEALAIRLKDIDFSVTPTKIHIRKEYAKTREGRDIYISDEATQYTKEWIDYKYRERDRNIWGTNKRAPDKNENDLVFQMVQNKQVEPRMIYQPLNHEFNNVLKTIGKDQRKEGMLRHKVTLNSFRRFVKSTLSDQVSTDYSEWFLGHRGSTYWTKKEDQKREIYHSKCNRYLTFLDYSLFETTAKNIESKLQEKDKDIEELRMMYANLTDTINNEFPAEVRERIARKFEEGVRRGRFKK